jgi:YGGT family protein
MSSINPVDRREDIRINEDDGVEQREVVTEDVAASQWNTLSWVSGVIWFVFGVLEALIGLRVIFRVIGANPQNPFANFVYSSTALWLAPFANLTSNPAVGSLVLEITSLMAMIIYALVAWGIVRLLWLLFYHPSSRVVSRYQRQQTHGAH